LVIRRVFEGGVGIDRGGMLERSIDIGVRDPREDGREERGEFSDDILIFGSLDRESLGDSVVVLERRRGESCLALFFLDKQVCVYYSIATRSCATKPKASEQTFYPTRTQPLIHFPTDSRTAGR
jgi:hypothetical protein